MTWSTASNGKRCPWQALQVRDNLHTLLARDGQSMGDTRMARWHIERRDEVRHQLDEAASAFCGRPVTGYTR